MKSPGRRGLLFILALTFFAPLAVIADEEISDKSSTNGPAAGHSLHGEAFDEGPRQAAVLMPGTGDVKIEITTKHPKAQAFFNQGVGQLEGFWYFEAERSFRQVAFYDTNCTMAYWGLAMANVNNTKRAADFIKRARDLKTNASPREVLWVEAYDKFYAGTNSETDRCKELVLSLEKIIQEYPDELEAKTFLAFHIWESQGKNVPVTSRMSIDALANEVLARQPLHPIHHVRIHLWNGENDKLALNSAASCGQSAPAIAHMWHMPGHTYSRLHRYDDAAWQQEAAARTDHAYMMATRILPDQIFNFAHNNQWLCTDLLYCGRVHDAIDLAKNMVELPRHPKYNTLNRKEDNTSYEKNNGSSMLGRNRLFDAFLQFELWDEMLRLADTMYLEPTELPEEQARRFYALSLAHFALGHTNEADSLMASIEGCSKQLRQERFEATEKAEQSAKKEKKDTNEPMVKAMKEYSDRVEQVQKYRDELKIWSLLSAGKTNDARDLLRDANELPKTQRARLWRRVGDTTNCVTLAQEMVRASTNQAPDLALASHLLWESGRKRAATKAFKKLRAVSSQFDLESPVLARLAPIAESLGLPVDWRVPVPEKPDVGNRPSLDSLGPFRWSPYPAPPLKLADAQGKEFSLLDFRGRPVLIAFYLGHGCSHCVEQLNLLADNSKDLEKQGIQIVAVSSDSATGANKVATKAKTEFPFPIVSDKSLETFKSYRAYDDFEQMPLHATFLVDARGSVRWQDISYDPFTDMKFLLAEARRLLGFGAEIAKR